MSNTIKLVMMDQNSRTLYADLFALDTSENDVKGLFSLFGKVKHLNMPTFYQEHPLNKGHSKPRCKGYAFIEYYSKDDATKACDFFNDLNTLLIRDEDRGATSSAGAGDAEDASDESTTKVKILEHPRYVAMIPIRTMLKSDYHELVRQFKEQKFQSLMRVAKTLAIV